MFELLFDGNQKNTTTNQTKYTPNPNHGVVLGMEVLGERLGKAAREARVLAVQLLRPLAARERHILWIYKIIKLMKCF